MNATPVNQIPEPVTESVKRMADNGVPCGCRWNLPYTGVYLCAFHQGMHDRYTLARTDPARTEGLNDYQQDRP